MAIDTRDWYRDKLRSAQGYVERARFRVPLGRPSLRRREPGVSVLVVVAAIIAAAWLSMLVLRYLLHR